MSNNLVRTELPENYFTVINIDVRKTEDISNQSALINLHSAC